MRIRYHSVICIFLMCVFCASFPVATSVDSQTVTFPLSLVVGYGGTFNPYVFWPSVGIKLAASSAPLIPFLPFNNAGFGLGTTFGALSGLSTSFFNPLLGFGSPVLTFGNPALSFAGLGNFGALGLGIGNPLGTLSLLGANSLLNPPSLASVPAVAPGIAASLGASPLIRTAAQSGSWTGTWTSTYVAFPILFHTGPMLLNIVVDPLLGAVVGTVIMQGSRYVSALTDVDGVIVNNVITLGPSLLATGYFLTMSCILISPISMTGFYTVDFKGTIMDEGVFSLTLIAPVIF